MVLERVLFRFGMKIIDYIQLGYKNSCWSSVTKKEFYNIEKTIPTACAKRETWNDEITIISQLSKTKVPLYSVFCINRFGGGSLNVSCQKQFNRCWLVHMFEQNACALRENQRSENQDGGGASRFSDYLLLNSYKKASFIVLNEIQNVKSLCIFLSAKETANWKLSF